MAPVIAQMTSQGEGQLLKHPLNPSFPVDPSNLGGGETTYLEVTGGVTIKPPVPKPLAGLMIRPEVRYDRSLTDRFKPFEQNTSRDQWTIGLDVILEF